MSKAADAVVDYACVLLAQYELCEWRPDVLGDPNSKYNIVHQIVHIESFKQALYGNFYAHLSPDITLINQLTLVTRFYNNYLYVYQRGLVMSEQHKPGSVAARADEANAYRWRKEVGLSS